MVTRKSRKAKDKATTDETIETPVDETIEDNTSESSEDEEADFFTNAGDDREDVGGNSDDDLEDDEEPGEEGDQPTISDTVEEDQKYFQMAMGLIDNNRAIALSVWVDGNLDNVDKYIYYNDWSDPKHQALLEAGGVVAKKYKLSAFRFLPEFAIAIAIIVSSGILYRMAKMDKEDAKKAKNQATAQPPADSKIVNINHYSKAQ